MNKKLLLVVGALVVVMAGAITYVIMTSADKTTMDAVVTEDSSKSESETPASSTAPEAGSDPGVYTDYTEQAVATTKGTKLLFFHASWCPQCRQIEASIKQDGVPDGVTVLKVDYDSHQDLRQKYGVTIQTTFVKIDDQGNKLASYVAYEEPRFSSVERELLK